MPYSGQELKNFFLEKINEGNEKYSRLKQEKEELITILKEAVDILSDFYFKKVNIVDLKGRVGFSLIKEEQLILEVEFDENVNTLKTFIQGVEQFEFKQKQHFIDFLNDLFENYYFAKIMNS